MKRIGLVLAVLMIAAPVSAGDFRDRGHVPRALRSTNPSESGSSIVGGRSIGSDHRRGHRRHRGYDRGYDRSHGRWGRGSRDRVIIVVPESEWRGHRRLRDDPWR